jgi:SAM-dependent methyltransferase
VSEAALVFRAEQGETLRRLEEAENYNSWLLERTRPHLGERVLDAGAGVGTFTQQLAAGRHVVALEPDPRFVAALRQRFAGDPNVEVAACAVEELDPADHQFDSILCLNVLEHIADDEAALRSFHRLLRPGGALLALVPAHPVAHGRIDDVLGHERRYRKRELGDKLQRAALTVEALRHVNPLGIAGWLVAGRVLRASQVPSRPLRAFDRLVPLLRALDRAPLPFGLSLWAVARRP